MATAPYSPQIPDSLNTIQQQPDTVVNPDAQPINTPAGNNDSAVGYFPVMERIVFRQPAAVVTIVPTSAEPGSLSVKTPGKDELSGWNSSRNFFKENGLTRIVTSGNKLERNTGSALNSGTLMPPEIIPHQRFSESHDWLLGVFFLLILLFIWIRIFYSKFFATLANALISFQIAAKLFREKNVLLHRVSIVLDFIYIVVFSVFIYELILYFELSRSDMSGINLFLLLLNIVMLYALFRIFILRLTGTLFLVRSMFAEYIHSNFVVNKGMGIALFPVVIMAQYFPHNLVPVVLIAGILIFGIAFILKSFRAYQIIVRKDVLLFYLILYLCTLEILPLLLGYKFVTSLI